MTAATTIAGRAALLALGSTLACFAGVPTALLGQDNGPSIRSDWTFTVGATADSNPFRLSDGQRTNLDPGLPEYFDMEAASDLGTFVGIAGDFRTRRVSGRRARFGFELDADVYGRNTARTRLEAAGFFALSFSKKDELELAVAYDPSRFRKTYVVGFDGSGNPTFAGGNMTRVRLDLSYERELYDGKGKGLDVKLKGMRRWSSFSDMPWRDRADFGAGVELDGQVSKALDLDVGVSWRSAAHDDVPEPYDSQMLVLNRDFTSLSLSTGLGLDLSKDAKLYLDYRHYDRAYSADVGEDPRYGGRTDVSHTFGGKLRYEVTSALDVFFGGSYRLQDTTRPATGSDLTVPDYRRTRVFVQLDYSR